MSVREDIEKAIVDDVKALAYLRTVKYYEGELSPHGELEMIRSQVQAQAPAVLVATGQGTNALEQMQRRRYTKELEVRVYVVSRNYRSRTEQRHGAGIYKIIDDVVSRLAGWDCGVDGCGHLQLRSEAPMFQEPDMTVWVLQFVVEVDVTSTDRDTAAAPDLEEISGRVWASEDESLIASGSGDSIAVSAGVVTFTSAAMASVAGWVGQVIRIEGAASAGNDGDFVITARLSATQVQFANPIASPETFAGVWKVLAADSVRLSEEV